MRLSFAALNAIGLASMGWGPAPSAARVGKRVVPLPDFLEDEVFWGRSLGSSSNIVLDESPDKPVDELDEPFDSIAPLGSDVGSNDPPIPDDRHEKDPLDQRLLHSLPELLEDDKTFWGRHLQGSIPQGSDVGSNDPPIPDDRHEKDPLDPRLLHSLPEFLEDDRAFWGRHLQGSNTIVPEESPAVKPADELASEDA